MKNSLTKTMPPNKLGTIESSNGAVLRLQSYAEEGGLIGEVRLCAESSCIARCRTVSVGTAITLGALLFVPNIEINQRRYAMPKIWCKPLQTRQDVSDRLENLSSVFSLLSDVISQKNIQYEFRLCDNAVFGLTNLFTLLEESIEESLPIILKSKEEV